MKIVVCIRQGLDGQINPFDACAYEAALCMQNAQITLLSMGAESTEPFLKSLTRLGAESAILLSDKAFAGADTLATAYTLSLAVKKLGPDLVICGRQTLIGDTGQVPPMLSALTGMPVISSAMEIDTKENGVICKTRAEGEKRENYPCIVTVERINTLRFPSIRSKTKDVTVLGAADIGADLSKCGLIGSPTRVIKTFENSSGRRKCEFISIDSLEDVIEKSLQSKKTDLKTEQNVQKLESVFTIGSEPYDFAKTVCDNITVIESFDENIITEQIQEKKPDAVLFASDSKSKRVAGLVAARLSLGLCADCTELLVENDELIMIRPALSGSVIAKIKSLTKPALASVRTQSDNTDNILIGIGFGAKESIEKAKSLAQKLGAGLCASRKMVDNSFLPYEMQVGLTGKSVSPSVYIAIGISGAVHHIVGMERSGTVIAINPDKDAPIFDYADYGIVAQF